MSQVWTPYTYVTGGVNECVVRNGGCQQHCVDTYDSYYCVCYKGYKIFNQQSDLQRCPPGRPWLVLSVTSCKMTNGVMYDPIGRLDDFKLDGRT